MKKNHKNDKRRITAEERADLYLKRWFGMDAKAAPARLELITLLGDHVRAAHRRHARKNICTSRKAKDL